MTPKTYMVPGTAGEVFTSLEAAVAAAKGNHGYVDVYEGEDLVDMIDVRHLMPQTTSKALA